MTHDDAAREPDEATRSTPTPPGGDGVKEQWRASRLLRIGTLIIGGLLVLGVGFGVGLATGLSWNHGGHGGHSMHGHGHHMRDDQRGGPDGRHVGSGPQQGEDGSRTAPTSTTTAPSGTGTAPSTTSPTPPTP